MKWKKKSGKLINHYFVKIQVIYMLVYIYNEVHVVAFSDVFLSFNKKLDHKNKIKLYIIYQYKWNEMMLGLGSTKVMMLGLGSTKVMKLGLGSTKVVFAVSQYKCKLLVKKQYFCKIPFY